MAVSVVQEMLAQRVLPTTTDGEVAKFPKLRPSTKMFIVLGTLGRLTTRLTDPPLEYRPMSWT